MTLGKAAFALFLAGLGYLAAHHFGERMGAFWTGVLMLASVALAGYGIVAGAAVIGTILADWRTAWAYPDIRRLQLIRSMSPEQLEVVANYGSIPVIGTPTAGGLVWKYRAPGGDLTPEEVKEMAEYCLAWPSFPKLPPTAGLPGDAFRDRLMRFTKMVEHMNLAHRPDGSQRAAEWRVNRKRILEALEVR